jgi:OPA family sugar phosphate sensor protein UhpC-like MFS transporter
MAEPADAPDRLRRRIFAMTWLSYFSYYQTRMPFKAAKTSLQESFALSKSQLNWIDTTYNIAYCVGQFTNGYLVERIGPRRWVAIGMLTSALVVALFPAIDGFAASVLGFYMLLWGINGFAQSTGWPGNGKAMAEWYGTARRGEVMGWWSTCYQAGGLLATLMAARVIGWFGWRGTFVAPAIWVAVVGLAFYLIVRDRPSQLGYRDPDSVARDEEERRALARAELPRVLRTPMIWALGGAYFCCKAIRYAFIFWLPFFLERVLSYSKASALDTSIAFDAGGVVFVVIAGMLADRVFARRRVMTAFVFLWLLVVALFAYRNVADYGHLVNVALLAAVGGCLFAADSLISGAVAQDVGGPHASGLAAGIVNGIGSIGQVLQGFVLVYVTNEYGWSTLFVVFAVLAGAGALCLVPYLRVGPYGPTGETPSARG